MTKRKIIAYRLQPVYELEPGSIATAAVMTCMATGRMLDGMGGGGDFLAPEIVSALRNDGRSKAVVVADEWDRAEKLEKHVREFVEKQDITCPETIYQTDRVIENAYEFIEGAAEIVGYAKFDDDEDGDD